MAGRWRMAVVSAMVAGLLGVAEVVWVVGFLGSAGDGPAFVMAFVATVLIPTLLATTGAVLLKTSTWRVRLAGAGAVAAAGLAAAGFEAGVFVGDDPVDPAFIYWVADALVLAFVAAVALSGVALWDVFRPMPLAARGVLSVVLAVLGSLVLAVLLLVGLPLVVLVGLAAPVPLVVVALATGRRQRLQPAT